MSRLLGGRSEQHPRWRVWLALFVSILFPALVVLSL